MRIPAVGELDALGEQAREAAVARQVGSRGVEYPLRELVDGHHDAQPRRGRGVGDVGILGDGQGREQRGGGQRSEGGHARSIFATRSIVRHGSKPRW